MADEPKVVDASAPELAKDQSTTEAAPAVDAIGQTKSANATSIDALVASQVTKLVADEPKVVVAPAPDLAKHQPSAEPKRLTADAPEAVPTVGAIDQTDTANSSDAPEILR